MEERALYVALGGCIWDLGGILQQGEQEEVHRQVASVG